MVKYQIRKYLMEIVYIYSGVIPYMSEITLQLYFSIFWIRARFSHNLLCSGYARIQKIEVYV